MQSKVVPIGGLQDAQPSECRIPRSSIDESLRAVRSSTRGHHDAICEAVGRPSMRFVPIKNIEQEAVLALHRV